MTTVHTPSQSAQPVTAPDLAALAAAVERLERLESSHASEVTHLNAKIATIFDVMRLVGAMDGVRVDEPLRALEGGAKPDRRRTRRPGLTAVGGSR